MKIAIYHELPTGGAKRALYEMVKVLRRYHDIEIFSSRNNEVYLPLSALGVQHYDLAQSDPFTSSTKLNSLFHLDIKQYERNEQEVAKMIDRMSYDVVFVHASHWLQSPSVLHYLHTPTVYYSQEVRRVWYEKKIRQRALGTGVQYLMRLRREAALAKLDARNIQAAKQVLVNSYYSAEAHKIAHGIDSQVVYLGCDTDYFKPARKKTKNSSLTLLSVGGLEPFKNQELIVAAAEVLVSEYDGVRIELVYDRYDSAYIRTLKERAARSSIDIKFYQGISDNELKRLYRKADVTVCAADLEPFGFTPLESIACGTPVAAIREGGYRETILDGKNGYFADNRKPASLAHAIQCANALKLDTPYFYEYVRARWSWRQTAESIESVFHQLKMS